MVFRDSGGSEDCLTLNVWTAGEALKAKAARHGVDLWRRIRRRDYLRGAAGRHAPRAAWRDRRLDELPARRLRFLRASRAGEGVRPEFRRQLRPARPAGRVAMGARKHRRIWRRCRKRNHLWRECRIILRERADGVAAGEGSVSERRLAKAARHSQRVVCRSTRCRSSRRKGCEDGQRKTRCEHAGRPAGNSSPETARCVSHAEVPGIRFWSGCRRIFPPGIGTRYLCRGKAERRSAAGGMESR